MTLVFSRKKTRISRHCIAAVTEKFVGWNFSVKIHNNIKMKSRTVLLNLNVKKVIVNVNVGKCAYLNAINLNGLEKFLFEKKKLSTWKYLLTLHRQGHAQSAELIKTKTRTKLRKTSRSKATGLSRLSCSLSVSTETKTRKIWIFQDCYTKALSISIWLFRYLENFARHIQLFYQKKWGR